MSSDLAIDGLGDHHPLALGVDEGCFAVPRSIARSLRQEAQVKRERRFMSGSFSWICPAVKK